MAKGMGGRIAVIDTERGSASKYSDRFDFDVLDLERPVIEQYIDAIHEAQNGGYNVLIIDSLSHGWQQLLEQIDEIAKTKFHGNTWSAWSEGTPLQRKFVDTIIRFNGHIIATMRSKTEWSIEQQEKNGKTVSVPVRVGLGPEQGKGIEYEFDLLIELNMNHGATVIKDRTSKFQDEFYPEITEGFGRDLCKWLLTGATDPTRPSPDFGTPPPPEGPPPPSDKDYPYSTEQDKKDIQAARQPEGRSSEGLSAWHQKHANEKISTLGKKKGAMVSRMYAIAKNHDWPDEAMKLVLKQKNYNSMNDVLLKDYNELCACFESEPPPHMRV
jgi:hypothetical protein